MFLAQHGFDVTGVDFAHSAIHRARRRAAAAIVAVEFVVDDLTNLRDARGPFDLLLDYGTFDDLSPGGRNQYASSVSQLAAKRAIFLLWCFEWAIRWWERHIPFFAPPLAAGEAERSFNATFSIDRVARDLDWSSWPPGSATYWMSRRP